MPFDLVILFLGTHPKNIIQKYVNALYAKIFTVGAFIIERKPKNYEQYAALRGRNDTRNHDLDTRKKIGIFKLNVCSWFIITQRHA